MLKFFSDSLHLNNELRLLLRISSSKSPPKVASLLLSFEIEIAQVNAIEISPSSFDTKNILSQSKSTTSCSYLSSESYR